MNNRKISVNGNIDLRTALDLVEQGKMEISNGKIEYLGRKDKSRFFLIEIQDIGDKQEEATNKLITWQRF